MLGLGMCCHSLTFGDVAQWVRVTLELIDPCLCYFFHGMNFEFRKLVVGFKA